MTARLVVECFCHICRTAMPMFTDLWIFSLNSTVLSVPLMFVRVVKPVREPLRFGGHIIRREMNSRICALSCAWNVCLGLHPGT